MSLLLSWKPKALSDRRKIMKFIAKDNPVAAVLLDQQIEEKAEKAAQSPMIYRSGRVTGTREAVVTKHYLLVYRVTTTHVEVLRVLHTSQQWP